MPVESTNPLILHYINLVTLFLVFKHMWDRLPFFNSTIEEIVVFFNTELEKNKV